MYEGKPIIGITGGIGAGKSTIASYFAELGCLVISSDEIVRNAYNDPRIRQMLRRWWGDEVFNANAEIDRSAIARKVFSSPDDRKKLEQLLHPHANEVRERLMASAASDARVKAYLWDTPLLVETGLDKLCDAVVFVDTPRDVRVRRVQQSRGWSEDQLEERENLQFSLDKKREISQYVISNTADADNARGQVRDTLSRILAESQQQPASP